MQYCLLTFLLFFTTFTCAQFLPLPPRPYDAVGGSDFVHKIKNLPLEKRENVIFTEICKGNVPKFLRKMVPITISRKGTTIAYYVTCDYMCIGDNSDYFYVPMTPLLAQRLADYMDCSLPTPQIVNDIWEKALVKMPPSPIPPSPDMTTVPVFAKHNTTVCLQRAKFLPQYPLGTLVGGNKKDVVITKRLATKLKRVAIYGWHRTNGKNIQPLYLGHIDSYADYSHGIRFVHNTVAINGQNRRIREVLANPELAGIISNEGPLLNPRYPVEVLSHNLPAKETFPSQGRDLSMWHDKFTSPKVTSVHSETVAAIYDPAGGMDTISLKTLHRAMYVEADIYCLYRPEIADKGFERVGIFIRDDGNAAFEHLRYRGSCYGMAWDSHNGRLWCFRADKGHIIDLNSVPVYLTESGWRKMRIEARYEQVTFFLNAKPVLSIRDDKYPSGGCGIGYHEYFADNNLIVGTKTKSFTVGLLD